MRSRARALILGAAILLAAGCGLGKPPSAWEALPLGTMADFRGIWFTDPQNGWIVGGNYNIPGGLIGRTRDGGRTWHFSSNLAETPVGRLQATAVRFFETQRGLVATGDGAIFATRDGGENWALVRHGSGSEYLNGFSFIDEERGWAVGHGGVLGTMDAGQHWRRLSPARGSGRVSGWAIHLLDDRTGWLAGMHGTLMYTVDGGITWESAAPPLPAADRPALRDVFFIDDHHGWVVGEEGTILATRDGGSTWVRQDTGLADARSAPKLEHIPRAGKVDVIDAGDRTPGLTLSAVRFVDRRRGWAAGYYAGLGRSLILRTQDGGATWAVDADIAGEELRVLFVEGGATLWAAGARVREGRQAIYRRALSAAAK